MPGRGAGLGHRLVWWLLPLAGVALLAWGLGRAGVLDRWLVYFPTRELVGTPADLGLDYEDVWLTASDGVTIHGWFVPGRRPVVWLWLHGNGGNISHRLENLRLLHQAVGVSVLLVDYRGYGRSEGTPSEAGLYADAEAALAHLRSREELRGWPVVYFGRSLGAAVAAELAVRHPPDGLVLESPFPSIEGLSRRRNPLAPGWLVRALVRARYETATKVAQVRAPVLVVHGDRDEIVPVEAGREVYEAANEPKEFYTVEGAGHNDTYLVGGEAYLAVLARLVARVEG